MPAAVQKWLAENPQYFNDAVAQAKLNLATIKCVREGKTWDDPDFIETIERHLGLKQEARPINGHDRPPMTAPTPPRNPPVRQQHYGGPPVSAPSTRDVPSFTTGRLQSEPTRLTANEADLARTLKISPEEYARQKAKMIQLKKMGAIQDGR